MIIPTILEIIGLQTAATVDPSDHLKAYLQDKSVLLVLDNLEDIMASGDEVIQAAYAEGLEMSLDEAIEHARNVG